MGHRAPLSAAGPGHIIWSGLPRSGSGNGHQKGCYRATVTLAESHMSSASSARSAVNAWITSSSSTRITCTGCCRHISNIISKPEPILRLPKIAPRYARYTRQPPAGSLPSRRSVACTIATNVAPRERYRRTHRGHVSTRAPFRLYNRMPQMQWRKDHLHGTGSQQRPVVLVNQSQLITHELFEEAIPRPDRVLSRDRTLQRQALGLAAQ